jgi:LysM domain
MAILDLIVTYRGAEIAQDIKDEETIFPRALPQKYTTQNAAAAGRKLVRLGEFTNTIKNASLIDNTVGQINFNLKNNTLGTVFIYGSSSGGRNALDLAMRLFKDPIFTGSLQYVALLDSAYFPGDTILEPNAEPPTNIPIMTSEVVLPVGKTRENFFQTAGNHREERFARRDLFVSAMGGKEIHGNVPFFSPRDLTSLIKDLPNTTRKSKDDGHHGNLIKAALPIAHGEIANILDTLIPAGGARLNFIIPGLDARTHTVVSGDNLSMLAKRFYGKEALWTKIYAANKAVIGPNPNLILVGQKLVIPK